MSLPRPTALGYKGIAFYGVLLGAFFGAPYANLFFLLLSFLTLLGGLGWLWTWREGRGVSARVIDPGPQPAGAPILLCAELDGRRRPPPNLRVELQLEVGAPVALESTSEGGPTATGALPALARGIHRVRSARWVTSWPFDLFRTGGRAQAPPELVVYPTPEPLAEGRTGPGGADDRCGPLGAERGMLQPSALREHREGEDLQRVHWKASARRGSLVVQEWEGGVGDGFEVVLDRRCEPSQLERALRLLSALSLLAREQKDVLTLHTQGCSGSFGNGQRPWRELLRLLAGADALPAGGPPPPPAPPSAPRLPRALEGAWR